MIGKTNVPPVSMLKSMIIVTAPSGSTVTCSNGSLTKTAIERNGQWIFRGILNGTWTVLATKAGQSTSKTVTISRLEVEYVTLSYRVTPAFTYTGSCEIVSDSGAVISDFAAYKGNWNIRFLTSGTFSVADLHNFPGYVDVFLVGGGGSGSAGNNGWGGAGGGGGYTKTVKSVGIHANTGYWIEIGAGGAGTAHGGGTGGGNSSAFGAAVSGGARAYGSDGAAGGSGGGGRGICNGGSDGANGAGWTSAGGAGQGTTTRAFGEAGGALYSGGGGGCNESGSGSGGAGGGGNGNHAGVGQSGSANTGGGGGGGNGGKDEAAGGNGGCGIVIIRNRR